MKVCAHVHTLTRSYNVYYSIVYIEVCNVVWIALPTCFSLLQINALDFVEIHFFSQQPWGKPVQLDISIIYILAH